MTGILIVYYHAVAITVTIFSTLLYIYYAHIQLKFANASLTEQSAIQLKRRKSENNKVKLKW